MRRARSFGLALAAATYVYVAHADDAPPPTAEEPSPGPDDLPPLPPPAPPIVEAKAPPDPAKKLRLSVRAEAGPFYRRFIHTPATGALGALGLGGQNDRLGAYGLLKLGFGSTAYGLRYREVQGSGIVEARVASFFRVGASVDVDCVFIQRATTQVYMNDLGVGLGLLVVTEPYTWGHRDDSSVFVSGKIGALGFLRRDGGPYPIQYGPELTAGVRF